ncbi:MAG: hypothetical protein ACTJFN_10830 [Sphingobacterium sp.]
MSTNQTKGAISLTGIHQVSVFFDPMGDFFAGVAKGLLNPDGNHYIKFTAVIGGITKVEFCDASGNTSGYNPGTPPSSYGDFDYATTKHYWKNQMPMALALQDVSFTFDDVTGNITNGNGVVALARRNGNPGSSIPSFINPNQDSDSSAAIITTTGNSASAFAIRIKLGFQIPFQIVLTKI